MFLMFLNTFLSVNAISLLYIQEFVTDAAIWTLTFSRIIYPKMQAVSAVTIKNMLNIISLDVHNTQYREIITFKLYVDFIH